jgi:CheY-like chemotaxis protein
MCSSSVEKRVSPVVQNVLIVEDNLLIAMEVAEIVADCGFAAVGPVSNPRDAMDAIDRATIVAALLDINLGEAGLVWPVADLLAARGVPFAFATGYADTDIPSRFSDRPLLTKPVKFRSVRECLKGFGLALPVGAGLRGAPPLSRSEY